MAKKHSKTRHGKTKPLAPDPTLAELREEPAKTAEIIEERRRAFVRTPEDIETIHRFRTSTRTLRSLIAFIRPWQNKKQNAETQRILKEVVGYTSRLRELDVLEGQVSADPDSSHKLIAFCKKEAAVERARVLKLLTSKRVKRSFKQAMGMAKNVKWKSRYVKQGLSADEVRARFDAMIESTRADLAALDLLDVERTHDVRKRAKRARYVAERYVGILGKDAVEIARHMNDQQDILGEICDARANIRLISEFLERDLSKSVTRDFKRLLRQNEAYLRRSLEDAEAKR